MNQQTPFNKILVANRGEIALRVMRTAHARSYRTVAVYSVADREGLHVREAGESVCIGSALPADSYLRIDAMIDAAKKSGADAVHPGYGFLAENAEFARACRAAGLVFIGPSPEAIDAMGDKASAKRLMLAAGVPCIPGYQGDDQSDIRLRDEAKRIGYPVMIKATAGGGGRGMRLVQTDDAFAPLLQSARSEAKSAFGDATVILERAITNARHIEIQIVADRYGNVIHLGERDCSVQRRHQKLIEESPSPAVTSDIRARMGEVAVKAAKAIGYEGVGTMEFLLDESGKFFFMEMNTRLQVEHPVTEAITGLDLVEMQLRIAAGEELPLAQSEVRFKGHAIEVRLCAEDVTQGFAPQSGSLRRWQFPVRLRVEHALESGMQITPFYDSMIAKIIAAADTRDEARRRLIEGLNQTVALGIATNRGFLSRCLAHPSFARGEATTAFIETYQDSLMEVDSQTAQRALKIAALLFQSKHGNAAARPDNRSLRHRFPVPMRLDLAGKCCDVRVTATDDRHIVVAISDSVTNFELSKIDGETINFVCVGVAGCAEFHRDGSCVWLQYDGEDFFVEDKSLVAAIRGEEKSSDGKVRASMNGRVTSVLVAVGDDVVAGQPMVVLEAMKMEHVHRAPRAGKVESVSVLVGDQVSARRVIAELQPSEPVK